MTRFNPDQTRGINEQPADVSIAVQSDRILLKAKPGGNIENGDILLVSYHTERTGWARVEVAYQETSSGVAVFTAGQANKVVVFVAKDLQQAEDLRNVRASVWQPTSSASDDFLMFHIFFNPLSPSSPFHCCNGLNHPAHILDVHSDPSRDFSAEPLGSDRHTPLLGERDRSGAVDHRPGTNPFDLEREGLPGTLRDEMPGKGEHEPGHEGTATPEPEASHTEPHNAATSASDFSTQESGAYR